MSIARATAERRRKALRLYLTNSVVPEPHTKTFRVRPESDREPDYFVADDLRHCTCKDYQIRAAQDSGGDTAPCKHILAVELFLLFGPNQPIVLKRQRFSRKPDITFPRVRVPHTGPNRPFNDKLQIDSGGSAVPYDNHTGFVNDGYCLYCDHEKLRGFGYIHIANDDSLISRGKTYKCQNCNRVYVPHSCLEQMGSVLKTRSAAPDSRAYDTAAFDRCPVGHDLYPTTLRISGVPVPVLICYCRRPEQGGVYYHVVRDDDGDLALKSVGFPPPNQSAARYTEQDLLDVVPERTPEDALRYALTALRTAPFPKDATGDELVRHKEFRENLEAQILGWAAAEIPGTWKLAIPEDSTEIPNQASA